MLREDPPAGPDASMEAQLVELYAQREHLCEALGTAEAAEIVSMVRSLEAQLADFIAAYGSREPLPEAGAVELLSYVESLAKAVTGNLGGKVGVSPRLFLKKLVADVMDRVDQFDDFDPRKHYALTISESEMTAQERASVGVGSVDDIEL